MTEKRNIKLPQGGTLEMEIQPGFYDRVRQHFGMLPGQAIDDDHIRMFVFGAVKGALDKVDGHG